MSIEHHIIGDTEVEVHRKKIKNLHVGVYPPDGRVRVAAPEAVSPDAIRLAVLTRMSWIRRKQTQFAQQERQPPRQYVSGETHYVFGRPFRLEVSPWEKKTHKITKRSNDRLRLLVPHSHSLEDRRKWMKRWLRSNLRDVAEPRVKKWSEKLEVSPHSWRIRAMKTKWGSCNPEKAIVWLNQVLQRIRCHVIGWDPGIGINDST